MRRRIVAAAFVIALACWAMALIWRPEPARITQLTPVAGVANEAAPAEPHAQAAAVEPEPPPEAPPAPTASSTPLPISPATADEQRVVFMYEALVQAYQEHSEDCSAVGRAFDGVVAEHAAAIGHVMQGRAQLDAEGRSAFDQRIQANFGPQLAAAAQVLQTAFAQCVADDGVKHAMQALASLNEG